MRIAIVCLTVCVSGCATSLQGGGQALLEDRTVSGEGTFTAGGGLGDGQGALLIEGRGTVGVDGASGLLRGSAVTGFEWMSYGGDFQTVSGATHFGIFGGARFDGHDSGLLFAEFGHAWVLGRSAPADSSSFYTLTSLSLAPMVGVVIRGKEDPQKSDMIVGLGLRLRSDSFAMWKFHL